MLLTKLYIINVNIIKRYKDFLIFFNYKFNYLFIIIKDYL
jgi:hypothetical protein